LQHDLIAFQQQFVASIDKPVGGPLAVYRNTVINAAAEALRANFPIVEQIIGEDMFEAVAADHAMAFPPRSPILVLYGGDFPDWVGQQPWAADIPYLADVARVERLHVESLMAADAEPLLPGAFPDHQVPDLSLRLHPATRFSWLKTPAMSIWLAHQRTIRSAIEPEWKPEGALFARPGPFEMHTPRLGRAAHRILYGIRIGERVAECLERTARLYPDENPEALFQSLVNLGAFAVPATERT
jgi:hypothetical protein